MNHIKSRRQFIQFVTSQTVVLGTTPLFLQGLTSCAHTRNKPLIKGIQPSFKDQLLLAEGLNHHIIASWGDRINEQGELFGFNNDFTCFLPINNSAHEGLLWVNHESVIPQFLHNKNTSELTRSKSEMRKELEAVGGSILHIQKKSDKWALVKNSKYNRRLNALTPIPFSQNTSIQGSKTAIGTLANCAGGLTPWNTFLTSEENYDDCYGEGFIENGKRVVRYKNKYEWHKHFNNPPEHYGWIVEVNPFTGKAEKQVLLGRAPHEGATVVKTKDNKAVVYMGEDRPGGYLYKFVSTGLHFNSGTLYAADTVKGRWLPLDIEKSPQLKKIFKNQLEVVTYAHQAAKTVGATPQDRPEDIQVHKQTGHVFIALTKNPDTNNKFGSLLKIEESKDHDSQSFQATTWLSGGLKSGLACPDNLCFDHKGNLWVTVDMSEKEIGKGPYKDFGNNGLYYIPFQGPQAGQPIQVASGPIDSELTGPWFSPDHKTLFLSVQHPGALTRRDISKPTSSWPNQTGLAKPSVVAIQGPLLEQLTR